MLLIFCYEFYLITFFGFFLFVINKELREPTSRIRFKKLLYSKKPKTHRTTSVITSELESIPNQIAFKIKGFEKIVQCN